MTPITMPAIAPPDNEDEVAEADAEVELVDEESEVDRDVEEVVAVAAIKARGSNVYELAEGFAEVREEYNEFSELLLIFVRVSWAELQQMLIWPEVCVHISLRGNVSMTLCIRLKVDRMRTFHSDNTTYSRRLHSQLYSHRSRKSRLWSNIRLQSHSSTFSLYWDLGRMRLPWDRI
jgi:hypothetical protein